uniref:Uncharacterized protein n=1 Tax=Ixodes ricinus TaxID=34613 RepID=A0A6B0U9L1_IXORI
MKMCLKWFATVCFRVAGHLWAFSVQIVYHAKIPCQKRLNPALKERPPSFSYLFVQVVLYYCCRMFAPNDHTKKMEQKDGMHPLSNNSTCHDVTEKRSATSEASTKC